MSVFNDIFQGVGDNARAGLADLQNKYQEVLTGTPAPQTSLTADMVTTSPAQEEPQSFDAALRQHIGLEQAELRAGYEAGYGIASAEVTPATTSPAPEVSSYEPEV